MKRFPTCCLWLAITSLLPAAEFDSLTEPVNRIASDDPAWKDLASSFAHRPDSIADFSEQRFFPFKKAPVELQGESRVSAERGLSLHYTAPEERTVILDAKGMLVRDARGESAAPADPRAAAANAALVQVLRFDLSALAENFEVFGLRKDADWTLAFVPRAGEIRRAVGRIIVAGNGHSVSRIELRRSAKQHITIVIGPPRPAPFSGDELRLYFR